MPTEPLVIGVVGDAGAGKNTIGDRLVAEHGFQAISFAEPLKILLCAVFEWNFHLLDDLAYKESVSDHGRRHRRSIEECEALITAQFPHGLPEGYDECKLDGVDNTNAALLLRDLLQRDCGPEKTRRQIMQTIGTEVFRQIDGDHWVKQAVRRILSEAVIEGSDAFVITDMRFLNEAAAMREEFNTEIWRVEKLGGEGTEATEHSSEAEHNQIGTDFTASASEGEIDWLHSQVDDRVNDLLVALA